MACWECLLLPQCVFTEPNSFLGRNGASLRNMCTTHLLLRTPKQTHTHIVSDSHRKHTTPPYTAATTTTTTKQQIKPLVFGVWQWCKLECRQVTRLSSSSSMRYYLLCDWNEWKKGKNKHLRGAYCDRLNGCTGFLEWTASWCFEGLCVVLRGRERLMNVSKAPCEQVCEAESGWSLPG